MVSFVYLSRIIVLASILLVLILGSILDKWEDVITHWKNLDFGIKMGVVVIVGWPIIGYVTPVLLDLWAFVTRNIIGLGGEYLITNPQLVLLLILVAAIAIQTTVLVVKLNHIEEEL